MTIWGKLHQLLYVRTKCAICKSPLKGERVETCSPACEDRLEQLFTW